VTNQEQRVSAEGSTATAVAEALVRLAAAVHRYRSMVARDRYGLDTPGGIAIIALVTRGPMPPGEVAALVNLTPPATTELLDRLDRLGYIERRPHPTDRRKLLVSPTPRASAGVHAETLELAKLIGPALPDDPDTNGLLTTMTDIILRVEQTNDQISGQSG
jgi:DNA-binding MarR family transcriptional regulator